MGGTSSRDIDVVRLSRAIEALYAAAIDPTALTVLPQRLGAVFDANSCQIHIRDAGREGGSFNGATEKLTWLMPEYVAHWNAYDEWAKRGVRHANHALFGEDLVPTDELLAASWYNDLLRRSEIHYLIGAVIELELGGVASVGIH